MLTNIERESLTALARTYHSIDRKLDEIANIHATDDLMASAAKVDRINSELVTLRQRAAFLRDKLNASSADAKAEAEYLYENGRTSYPRGFWSYAESNFAPYTAPLPTEFGARIRTKEHHPNIPAGSLLVRVGRVGTQISWAFKANEHLAGHNYVSDALVKRLGWELVDTDAR